MNWLFLLLSFIISLCASPSNCSNTYTGHKVVKLETKDYVDAQLLLRKLENDYFNKFGIYRDPTKRDPSLYLEADSDVISHLVNTASAYGVSSQIVIHDLQKYIEEWIQSNERRRSDDEWFERYHEYEEIMEWVDGKADLCGINCEILQLNSNSYEGRLLKVIKIGSPGENKEKLWIDATIHAREWIAPAVAQYFIERLIDDYGVDDDVTYLVDTYDFYIEPVVNPDGYVYSWTTDRLWRKSRLVNESVPLCIGTDLNRNFDFHWNTVGVGLHPCQLTWPGYSAFSDPEARALGDFILDADGNWTLFFTMHSYSQLWMLPYGYTAEHIPDYDKLSEAAQVGTDALEAVYGTQYQVGAASEILYESSGTSRDWAKGVAAAEYVYTIELRDTGEFEFELPPEQILPCVQETWAGFKAFLLFI